MANHDSIMENDKAILFPALRIQTQGSLQARSMYSYSFLGNVSVHIVAQLKHTPFKTCENHLPNVVMKPITIS